MLICQRLLDKQNLYFKNILPIFAVKSHFVAWNSQEPWKIKKKWSWVGILNWSLWPQFKLIFWSVNGYWTNGTYILKTFYQSLLLKAIWDLETAWNGQKSWKIEKKEANQSFSIACCGHIFRFFPNPSTLKGRLEPKLQKTFTIVSIKWPFGGWKLQKIRKKAKFWEKMKNLSPPRNGHFWIF